MKTTKWKVFQYRNTLSWKRDAQSHVYTWLGIYLEYDSKLVN